MTERPRISDVELIRVLGEYTAKATRVHQQYVMRRALLLTGGLLLFAICGVVVVMVRDYFPSVLLLVYLAIMALLAGLFYYTAMLSKVALELAAWQLRRIYELVSRREDLGVDVDSGTRLEMELRLSEAAFLLTSLERFERPEKFRHFQRVGRNSPFRELETENSSPTPATKTASSRSEEAGSGTSPDYSASTS